MNKQGPCLMELAGVCVWGGDIVSSSLRFGNLDIFSTWTIEEILLR